MRTFGISDRAFELTVGVTVALIVVAAGLLFAMLIDYGIHALRDPPTYEGAHSTMRETVERTYPMLSDVAIECTSPDTAWNGYVRCIAIGTDTTGRPYEVQRECGYGLDGNLECVPVTFER